MNIRDWRLISIQTEKVAVRQSLISNLQLLNYSTIQLLANSVSQSLSLFISISLILPLIACTPLSSTRPIIKFGLIAPFEGLYRQSGYEALAAMRAAIADNQPQIDAAGIDILPLAMDDQNDPSRARRTAQKLLQDESLQAIVGPLNPATGAEVASVVATSNARLIAPYTLLETAGWPELYMREVAETAVEFGAERLLLAGSMEGWPMSDFDEWGDSAVVPVEQLDRVEDVAATDALLWTGNSAEAADFLVELRAMHPSVPFVLAWHGYDAVFIDRATAAGVLNRGNIYWATWLDDAFEPWAESHEPATPAAYLIYRATEQAIAAIANSAADPTNDWTVQIYKIEPDGEVWLSSGR